MTLAGRIALARRVREIGRSVEFLEASDTTEGRLEAAIARGEVDRAYLEWGLRELEGLEINGRQAGPIDVHEHAPIEFALEVIKSIRKECGLEEDERKN